jgi:hypothetical protein
VNEVQRIEEKVRNESSSSRIVYNNPYTKRSPARISHPGVSVNHHGSTTPQSFDTDVCDDTNKMMIQHPPPLVSPSPNSKSHNVPFIAMIPPLQCFNLDLDINNQTTKIRQAQLHDVHTAKKAKTSRVNDDIFRRMDENSSNVTHQDDMQPGNRKIATVCNFAIGAEQRDGDDDSLMNQREATNAFNQQENMDGLMTTDTKVIQKYSEERKDHYREAIRGEKRFRLYLSEPPETELGSLKAWKRIKFTWIMDSFIAFNQDLGRAYYGGFVLNGREFHTGEKVLLVSWEKTAVIISCYQATKSYQYYNEKGKLKSLQERGKHHIKHLMT